VEPGSTGLVLSFTVKNTGKVTASEVAQIYVACPEALVLRPARELKGYEKVCLKKGESRTVSVVLPNTAFARYRIDDHNWVVDPGKYLIQVGSSAEDIRLEVPVVM
jgi:beta-glucosidase